LHITAAHDACHKALSVLVTLAQNLITGFLIGFEKSVISYGKNLSLTSLILTFVIQSKYIVV